MWALILIAWSLGSFIRLYWIEEANLPEKRADYHWQGELLPNTHDSYFFGAIVQKAHLGLHQHNAEIPDAYKYGPVTLLPSKLLDIYNAPVHRDLRLARAHLLAAGQALESAPADNATATTAAALAIHAARQSLAGPFLVPKMLRKTAEQAAETARQVAQQIPTNNAAVTDALVLAEKTAVKASKGSLISVEEIMAYSPAFIGSLLVVPLIFIGRLYGLTYWGFLAALMAVTANSYYNRSMAGYFDTDMLSVPIPMAIVYCLLRAVRRDCLWSAVAGAWVIMMYPFCYRSGMSIAAALGLAFIAHQVVFRFRQPSAWQSIVPVALGILFVDAMFPVMDATGSRTIPALICLLKILAVAGSAVLVQYIPRLFAATAPQATPASPLVSLRWACAIALLGMVLFSSPFSLVAFKIKQYLPSSERTSVVAAGQDLQFKNVISTIQEAREIPGRDVGSRIGGTVVGCIMALFGYALLSGRHPEFLIAAPLVGIGVFTLWGGLRFTIHAAAIAGLSFTYLFVWQSAHAVARTCVRAVLVAAVGGMTWSWLVNITGAPLPWAFLPLAALAGWTLARSADEDDAQWPTFIAAFTGLAMVLLGCLLRSEFETRHGGIWGDRFTALFQQPLSGAALLAAATAAITAVVTRGKATPPVLLALRVLLGSGAIALGVWSLLVLRGLAPDHLTGVGWDELPIVLQSIKVGSVLLLVLIAGGAVYFAMRGNARPQPSPAAIPVSQPDFFSHVRPALPALVGLGVAVVMGVAWACLARALHEPLPYDPLNFRPLPEPLTFGPWAIGLVTGLAVAWVARAPSGAEATSGWPRAITAAVTALIGLAVGVYVLGQYLDATTATLFAGEDAAVPPKHAPLALALMAAVAALTAGVLPGLLQQGTRQTRIAFALGTAGTVLFLTPNLLHARDQSRGIPPVLETPSVEILDALRAHAKPGDYVLTWWDYGGATWYHAGCNVICHPGNQTEDIYILARLFSATNKVEVSNLGRLAVEAYSQKGPLAVHHVMKSELGEKDDFNRDGRDDWTGLPTVGQIGPRGIARELGSAQYQPPAPTRDIYFYLPKKLLPILQVMRQFSERDLWPVEREFQMGLNHQTGASVPDSKPDPRIAIDWFGVAAEKGHAEAQFRLAGLLRDEYVKSLPPPLVAAVNEALKKGAAGREQLAKIHESQKQRGQGQDIENAYRWACRAAIASPSAFTRPTSGKAGDEFAAQDPAKIQKMAEALREQIYQFLPIELARALRADAEQFIPRDAEYSIPTFYPTPIRLTLALPAQTEAIFMGDRFLVDRADLRLYETTRGQGGMPGLEPARAAEGIAIIRSVAQGLAGPGRNVNNEALGQQVAAAMRMIHPAVNITPQVIQAPLDRREPAVLEDFARQAMTHWFDGTDKRHGALLHDGRVVIGAVQEVTLDHLVLVGEKATPVPNKPNEFTRAAVPVEIPWRAIQTIYRPSSWLNQLFIVSQGPTPAKLPSGATVEGELVRQRQTGLTPGSAASDLNLVIAHDLGVAYLMHRDIFHSNIAQMLLMGLHDDQRFELIYHNREGKLYRFKRPAK